MRTAGPGAVSSGTSPSDVRLLGRRFDRLSIKLGLGAAILVVLPLAGGLYVLASRQYERGIETRRRAAEIQNRILEAALRHQMMEKDPTLLTAILREVGTQQEVERAMILDHEGRIRIASAPELVGGVLSKESSTCLVCHANRPEDRDSSVLLSGEDGAILRSVLPIENRVECHQCHDPEKRLNGILILDLSLGELQAVMRRDLTWIFVGAGVVAVLLLTGVGLLVRVFLIRRLARLGRTARSIAAGNLEERADVDGTDIIGALASDFNDMAVAVSRLVEEVEEREAQLTSVLSSLEDGLVVLDRDSRVVACNESFSRRLGAKPEELQGLRCREMPAGGLPCCVTDQECPATRCATTGRVQRVLYPIDGDARESPRVEEVYASPVFDPSGRVFQVVEIWRDISERVQEEERLAEIERLASLGVLASGFSHEVNTPLASMLTCAEGILRRIDADGESGGQGLQRAQIRDQADIIRAQVLRCRAITAQFLRFSRGIPPTVEHLDLRRKVADVVSLVRPTAREARVEIHLDLEGAVPTVAANSEVVQHVVLNLLVNAIQSCEGRGGKVTVGVLVDGDVRLEIEDDGCGIAREDQRHLFEPFRSRKPQGTGLGLFLSRRFMRRFGGDVQLARSAIGRGSCFHIVFVKAEGDRS